MYVTIQESDTYFSTALDHVYWDEASSDRKTRALSTATRLIDALNFAGSKTVAAQEYEFPRGTDLVVPQAIKDACCERAYALLSGRDPEMESFGLNQYDVGIGGANVKSNITLIPDNVLLNIVSTKAWSLLRPFLRDSRDLHLSRIS